MVKRELNAHANSVCAVWQRGYNTFLCSTQLSMKFSLLINMKLPANVGFFIFIVIENFCIVGSNHRNP